jgi:hypothetical protein
VLQLFPPARAGLIKIIIERHDRGIPTIINANTSPNFSRNMPPKLCDGPRPRQR